jgi:Na+-transporting NADH:ubiquinone oxidoreductase subunit NqrC
MGRPMTEEDKKKYEYALYKKEGGEGSDQRIYHVNPYRFARTVYTMSIDPDQIINHAMGNDRQQKILAFQMLTDPRVAPYTDQKNVVDDFVIEEFTDGDPDRYKNQQSNTFNVNQAMGSVMGGNSSQRIAPQTKNTSLPQAMKNALL